MHIGFCKEVYMCMHCVVHCLGENKQLQKHSKPTIELSVLLCHGVNRKQPCVVGVSLCEQKPALCCWCVMV